MGFFYGWIKELISRHTTADLTAVLNNSIVTVTAEHLFLAVSQGNRTPDTAGADANQLLKPFQVLMMGFFSYGALPMDKLRMLNCCSPSHMMFLSVMFLIIIIIWSHERIPI